MQLPLPRARRHARAPLSCALTLALGLLLGLTLTPARAATLTVTSAADDGSAGTLRSVVAAAGAGDTVVFAPNVTLITLKQGQITLSNPITIQGPGAALLAIDGNQNGRVFAIVNSTGVAALSGLTVQNGAVNNDVGGGVFVSTGANASAQLTACILSGNNSGSGFGGGLYNGGTVTLIGCQVSGNNASLGGGLYNAGPMTLSGCAIKGNRAANGGGPGNAGGGLSNDGPATITDCAFVGNSSPMEGGAIDNGLGLTLSDCLLVGNSAAIGGAVNNVGVGGLGGGGSVTATGCTFTGNAASNSGGGAALNNNNGAAATLTDDILTDTGGETYNDPGMPGNPDDPASTATVSHCDFPGGVPSGLTDGGGNTSGPADFVTPYTAAGAAFDLHLKSGSACIGAGTTSAPGSSYLPADIDGRARPSTPSIGAYEAPPAGPYSLVVENTLDGVPMSLRTAVQCADDYPDARITFDPTAFATFQTITETQGTLTLSQPMTITGPAAGVAVDGNKANSVFTVTGGTGSGPIALSGLTVRNGRAGESFYPSDAGGGVYNDNGTLTLTGCTLEGNSASYFGGGVFNDTGTLTLTGCTLTGNSAPNGGGVYNTVGTVTLTGCTLEGNSAQGGTGGGVFNDDHGTVTLTDDILYGDTGGEVHDLAYASVSATYCDIGQSGYAGSNGNIDADPLLSPLGNYGGPTQTFALLPGSPCLGAGVAVSGVTTDQRGVSRAQAHGTDIGAFESQGFIVFIMSGGGQQAVVGTAFPPAPPGTGRLPLRHRAGRRRRALLRRPRQRRLRQRRLRVVQPQPGHRRRRRLRQPRHGHRQRPGRLLQRHRRHRRRRQQPLHPDQRRAARPDRQGQPQHEHLRPARQPVRYAQRRRQPHRHHHVLRRRHPARQPAAAPDRHRQDRQRRRHVLGRHVGACGRRSHHHRRLQRRRQQPGRKRHDDADRRPGQYPAPGQRRPQPERLRPARQAAGHAPERHQPHGHDHLLRRTGQRRRPDRRGPDRHRQRRLLGQHVVPERRQTHDHRRLQRRRRQQNRHRLDGRERLQGRHHDGGGQQQPRQRQRGGPGRDVHGHRHRPCPRRRHADGHGQLLPQRQPDALRHRDPKQRRRHLPAADLHPRRASTWSRPPTTAMATSTPARGASRPTSRSAPAPPPR